MSRERYSNLAGHSDIVATMSKNEVKSQWVRFLECQKYTHAVTLKPNDVNFAHSSAALHSMFVRTHMLVQRRLLGPRFNAASRWALQSPAMAIVEGLPACGHLHAAFRIRSADWERFEALFDDGSPAARQTNVWRKVSRSGSCAVVRMEEPAGWHRYSFKHVWETDDLDRVVLLPLNFSPTA